MNSSRPIKATLACWRETLPEGTTTSQVRLRPITMWSRSMRTMLPLSRRVTTQFTRGASTGPGIGAG